jgi:hypothetical protein
MVNPMPKDREGHTPSEIIREIGSSAKDLVQSEIDLARQEIKVTGSRLAKHSAQGAIFGALLSLSVLPFLAFLVIGLGRILNDQYWLSSLIIAAVCAVVGGIFTYRAYQKIKEEDLTLPKTREGIERGKEAVSDKVQDIKNTPYRRTS